MNPTKLACLLAPALLLATALRADEVRLRDGRVLYGKVTVEKATNTWLIETRDGAVRVAKDDVVDSTDDAGLRKRLRELAAGAGDTPFAHLQLAMRAREFGLDAELWQQLDAAVQGSERESTALQNRLDDFLGQLEPDLLPRKWRTANTDVRVRELLQRHSKNGGPGRRAALLELLHREPNADKDLRAQARRNGDAQRRLLAVEALVLRGTAGNDSFAWRTAILDRDSKVRSGAIDIAMHRGVQAGAVDYLAPGLAHSSPEVRVRTAEAFERLRDPAAIKMLVMAGPNAGKALADGGQGSRAYIAFVNQQAYIRDFDVEVAQASFIADPKIDVLQSGTVLDVTVHGVYEEQVRITLAYRTALQHLAGSDPGADPRAWAAWLAQQPPQQPTATTPDKAPDQPAAGTPRKN